LQTNRTALFINNNQFNSTAPLNIKISQHPTDRKNKKIF
jgi:hypothetical protein